MTLCDHRTCACWAVPMKIIRGKRHLPGNGCFLHCWVVIFMYHEGLCKVLSVRFCPLSGKHLIHLPAGIFDCSTVRSFIMAPV